MFEPRSRYHAYMPNSSYYNVSSYTRELKKLRSRDTFQLYGEPNNALFEAARMMGYLIIEREAERTDYRIYMLLKKRDTQKYLKEMENQTDQKKEPVIFDTKDLWTEGSQATA